MSPEIGCVTESHHPRTQEAISRLKDKVNRLRNLREEIQTGINPEKQPMTDHAPEPVMSLADVLEKTPIMLNEVCEEIDTLIADIRGLIF